MDLFKILADHKLWLKREGGSKADLRGANLQGADLRDANLQDADLQGANLQHADLRGADLLGANLRYANLQDANLWNANLWNANLQYADLHGANLQDANLLNTHLHGANLKDTKISAFQIPQEGSLIVWKKGADSTLIKLKVLGKRTAVLRGRKCRTDKAKVLEIRGRNGRKRKRAYALHDTTFMYVTGKIVKEPLYNDDIRIECTTGIHFFLTKKEAEEY